MDMLIPITLYGKRVFNGKEYWFEPMRFVSCEGCYFDKKGGTKLGEWKIANFGSGYEFELQPTPVRGSTEITKERLVPLFAFVAESEIERLRPMAIELLDLRKKTE